MSITLLMKVLNNTKHLLTQRAYLDSQWHYTIPQTINYGALSE